jgi:hypothetical protein
MKWNAVKGTMKTNDLFVSTSESFRAIRKFNRVPTIVKVVKKKEEKTGTNMHFAHS